MTSLSASPARLALAGAAVALVAGAGGYGLARLHAPQPPKAAGSMATPALAAGASSA